MNRIIVPSQNIYEYKKISSNDNTIENISANLDIANSIWGNIIEDNFSIPFYKHTEEGFDLVPQSDRTIDFNTTSQGTQGTVNYKVIATLKEPSFKIEKNIVPSFQNEANGETTLKGLEISYEDHWSKSDGTTETIKRGYKGFWALYDADTYSILLDGTVDDFLTEITIQRVGDRDTDGNIITAYLTERTIRILGDYIEREQKNYKYSEDENSSFDAKFTFNLPSNQLIQHYNFERLAKNVVRSYKNGKEVYTLKCSISEYYNDYGGLAISTEKFYNENKEIVPMLFQKYDKVKPYILTSGGEVPLSKDDYGNPKVFEVIGTDFSYSGVPWQELTIQEWVE